MEVKTKTILISLSVFIVIILGTNIWTGIRLRRSRSDYVVLEQSYSSVEAANIQLGADNVKLEAENIRSRRILDSANGDIATIESDLDSARDSVEAIEIGVRGLYKIIRTIKDNDDSISDSGSD